MPVRSLAFTKDPEGIVTVSPLVFSSALTGKDIIDGPLFDSLDFFYLPERLGLSLEPSGIGALANEVSNSRTAEEI